MAQAIRALFGMRSQCENLILDNATGKYEACPNRSERSYERHGLSTKVCDRCYRLRRVQERCEQELAMVATQVNQGRHDMAMAMLETMRE